MACGERNVSNGRKRRYGSGILGKRSPFCLLSWRVGGALFLQISVKSVGRLSFLGGSLGEGGVRRFPYQAGTLAGREKISREKVGAGESPFPVVLEHDRFSGRALVAPALKRRGLGNGVVGEKGKEPLVGKDAV